MTKPLHVDEANDIILMLARIGANTSYPRHRHIKPEDILILSGDLHIGGRHLHAGDYHRAECGVIHDEVYSDAGCVAMIQSSLHDELSPN